MAGNSSATLSRQIVRLDGIISLYPLWLSGLGGLLALSLAGFATGITKTLDLCPVARYGAIAYFLVLLIALGLCACGYLCCINARGAAEEFRALVGEANVEGELQTARKHFDHELDLFSTFSGFATIASLLALGLLFVIVASLILAV